VKRLVPIVLTVVLALGGAIGLIAFFQSRDKATVGAEGGKAAPGVKAPEENDPRLQAGNVILTYKRAEDGAVLNALAEDIAGPADDAVTEAGLAVIVLRRPNQSAGEVVGHAKGRRLVVDQPDDPQVRDFVEYYLGREGQ
jgi:hypothetical protein